LTAKLHSRYVKESAGGRKFWKGRNRKLFGVWVEHGHITPDSATLLTSVFEVSYDVGRAQHMWTRPSTLELRVLDARTSFGRCRVAGFQFQKGKYEQFSTTALM